MNDLSTIIVAEHSGYFLGMHTFDDVNIGSAVVGDAGTQIITIDISDIYNIAAVKVTLDLFNAGGQKTFPVLFQGFGSAAVNGKFTFSAETAEHPAVTAVQMAGDRLKPGA